MHRTVIATLLGLLPLLAMAAEQQMFRYIDKDGKVVYTDTAPPPDARSVQQKKLGGNYIETSETPYVLQVAQQRNPVTLYAGNCGPLCDQSRALLNRRGVPYREVDPSQPGEAAKLKQVTADMQVPILASRCLCAEGLRGGKVAGCAPSGRIPEDTATKITALRAPERHRRLDEIAGKGEKAEVKGEARG
jgi:hypothetical protein